MAFNLEYEPHDLGNQLHPLEAYSEGEVILAESTDTEFEVADVINIEEVRAQIDTLYKTTPEEAEVTGSSEVNTGITNRTTQENAQYEPVKASRLMKWVEGLLPESNFRPRAARFSDLDKLVEVDIRAFSSVYTPEERDSDEFKADLRKKFENRIRLHGGDWLQLLEKDDEICGFINVCPTNKTPEEFESWEQTTDNGTLERTYDPDGKNLYIVSLSMVPTGSEEQGQNMLFANQIGKMVEEGYDQAFFESRLPGLRSWVRAQCRKNSLQFDELSKGQKQEYAETYFRLKKDLKGKEVYHDRLLRIYDGVGCKFLKVVPDAYQDVPSMNFGAVCVYENPLPKFLRGNWLIRKVVGKSIRLASNSHTLMQKLF